MSIDETRLLMSVEDSDERRKDIYRLAELAVAKEERLDHFAICHLGISTRAQTNAQNGPVPDRSVSMIRSSKSSRLISGIESFL